ncbi:MAG: YjgP/YjgQ family permease, partial [Armatimonadetes bacterium]|nr:YjgP/YjgQ family permease [Armatimonadota bacterium]
AEVLGPLLIGTLTFVVLIVGHLLFQVIRPVVERGVPFGVVVQFVLLQTPNAVALALPVSMLLAAAIGVHRMARDNELVAVRAAGAGLTRLLAPVWGVGIGVSAFSFVVAEYVQPKADRRAEGIITGVLMSQQTLALEPGQFAEVTPEVYVLPGAVDDRSGRLSDLRVFYVEPKGAVTFMQARSARFEGERFVLERPLVCRIDAEGGLTRSSPTAGARAIIHLPRAIEAWSRERRTLRNMSVAELSKAVRRQDDAAANRPLLLELHGRLSLAFACLAFSLIGAPLALLFRGGRSLGGALIAILYAFIYYVGMLWARMLGESGALTPVLAAWLPNTVTAALGALLLSRRN